MRRYLILTVAQRSKRVVNKTCRPVTRIVTSMPDKIDYWQDRWSTGKTGWHNPNSVNKNLEKQFDKLTAGRKDLTFLFPLCGKTIDMLWVYKQVNFLDAMQF